MSAQVDGVEPTCQTCGAPMADAALGVVRNDPDGGEPLEVVVQPDGDCSNFDCPTNADATPATSPDEAARPTDST